MHSCPLASPDPTNIGSASAPRARVLTGDTPTGRLHLGHWVGSLEKRVAMQESYDCYFLLANMHAYTTRFDKTAGIRADTIEIVKDWLAAGIDPEKCKIVLQTEVPAIAELTWYFAMLLGFRDVMGNPTLVHELKTKNLEDRYSFGFPMYTVGQCADILAFRPVYIPVGEDQEPHIEMCRKVARKFDQLYCNVSDRTPDEEYEKAGGLFPIPKALIGRIARLPGVGDGTNKMSKSLNNAIFLSDSAKDVQKKINKITTGRQSPTEPGDCNNVLFKFVEAFIPDTARIAELKDKYTRGDNIGDGHIKQELAENINILLEPMRVRRARFEQPDGEGLVLDIIKSGTARANITAEETLYRAKQAMKMDFGSRVLR
jgi:tryptophanyl-tRNA synthetase